MIYITSMNTRLFECTGHKLIESFLKTRTKNDYLVVYTEGDIPRIGNTSINLRPIDNDDFLNSWLYNNRDITPKEFGGEFECDCDHKDNHMLGHKKDCPGGGMRRRAAHWFRKVASWRLASYQFDRFTWIDCDTQFKHNIPSLLFEKFLFNCNIGFHYGKGRQRVDSGIESGFVLFDGGGVINKVCELLTGDFRQEKRWDDAWMLTIACRELGLLERGDMHPECTHTHPMKDGPFSRYINHDKGTHWKNYGVDK